MGDETNELRKFGVNKRQFVRFQFNTSQSSAEILDKYFSIKNETRDLKPLTELFHSLQKENFSHF